MSTHPEDVSGDFSTDGYLPERVFLDDQGNSVRVPVGAKGYRSELDVILEAEQRIRDAFSGVEPTVSNSLARQNAAEAAADALASILNTATFANADEYLTAKAAADEWRRVR